MHYELCGIKLRGRWRRFRIRLGLLAERLLNWRRWRALRVARRRGAFVAAGDAEATFLFDSRDRILLNRMFLSGDVDRAAMERFFALAEKYYPGARGIFFEAGGNVGTAALRAARHPRVTRVVSFEPQSGNARLFAANRLLNGFDEGKVALVRAALSNREGTLELEVRPANFGACRLRAGGYGGTAGAATETVRVTTLDAYAAAHGIAPGEVGFLWLDVERCEGFALDGARLVTENPVPARIEFCPRGLRESGNYDLLLEVLRRHYGGYIDMAGAGGRREPAPRGLDDLPGLAAELEAIGPEHSADLFLLR